MVFTQSMHAHCTRNDFVQFSASPQAPPASEQGATYPYFHPSVAAKPPAAHRPPSFSHSADAALAPACAAWCAAAD